MYYNLIYHRPIFSTYGIGIISFSRYTVDGSSPATAIQSAAIQA